MEITQSPVARSFRWVERTNCPHDLVISGLLGFGLLTVCASALRFAMGFRAAEGYATLELWQDALDELSEMPSAFRNSPAVLRLELRACVALETWEHGEAVARNLATMGGLDRMMAAGFHAAHGHELLRKGMREEALRVLRRAVETWPSCKDVVLKNPGLVAAML